MVKELLFELGYTNKKIDKIVSCYTLKSYPEESLVNKIKDIYKFFLNLGYSENEIIKMTSFCPQIYGNSKRNMTDKISDMLDIGYEWEQIKKMTISSSKLFTFDIESIKNMISEMIKFGYTLKQVLKMTVKAPEIFGLGIKRLNNRITDMENLGYSREEILKMTFLYPEIYTLAIETIIDRKNNLISLGYTEEEAKRMTIELSTIYGYTKDNMKQKVEFYNSVDLHQMTIDDPRQLRQSVELSYARYKFYSDREIVIDINNYRKLFISRGIFEKKYKISNGELLQMYSYEEYIREKNNGRIV